MTTVPFRRRSLSDRRAGEFVATQVSFAGALRPLAGVALAALLAACSTTVAVAPSHDASSGSTRFEPDRAAFALGLARSDKANTPHGAVLNRAEYVRAVLQNNPTIEAARQGRRAALARVRQAGSLEDPMIDVGVAPLSIGSSKAPLGYEIAVSQKLPWFGKQSLEEATSTAEAEAAKSDYESVRRELALTAIALYDQYFVVTRSLEINAQHIDLMRAIQAGALAQFSSGRGSAQDALQAEAELTHMEHDALLLASQRDITVAQMNELLHRAPELSLPPPPAELPLPPEPDASAQHLQAEAVQTRPDIAAAREHAKAEQSRAARADRESYPDFTISTSYNSMWDMPEHRWMVGLGLNVPIQSGRRAGAADEAQAMRSQFESDAERLSDAARAQVFVSLKQLDASKHLLLLFETRLLPVAKDQIDAARAGFVTSRNPFVAVIDAERNLRAVELDYQMARAEYGKRRAELDRALGRIPGLDWKEASK
jgi:outer membrane protein, heavy metal efflux system